MGKRKGKWHALHALCVAGHAVGGDVRGKPPLPPGTTDSSAVSRSPEGRAARVSMSIGCAYAIVSIVAIKAGAPPVPTLVIGGIILVIACMTATVRIGLRARKGALERDAKATGEAGHGDKERGSPAEGDQGSDEA
jgi:hypothetical protein